MRAPEKSGSFAFLPDGKLLVLLRPEGIELWDLERGESLGMREVPHYGTATVVLFAGGRFVSGGEDGTALVCPPETALNRPPVAEFTWEVMVPEGRRRIRVEPRAGEQIRFDASPSHDPDGEIREYDWDLDGDGIFDAKGKVVEATFETPGEHRVTLRVTDDRGATDEVTKAVGVLPPPVPPTADFSFSPERPTARDEVRFTDRSEDPDGEIVAWEWDFGDGTTSDERNPVHRYSKSGTYTVRLVVRDADGLEAEKEIELSVVNLPPEAAISFTPEEPEVGERVVFSAKGSSDPDGEIVGYSWDFDGDGKPEAEGPEVGWSFAEEGTHSVSLVVEDNLGETDEEQAEVKVVAPRPVEVEEVRALVVGISDYKDVPDLRFAEADARAFASFLKDSGVPEDHIHALFGESATLARVRAGFKALIREASPGDLVIIFFAGHGYRGDDLEPVDEEDRADEYLVVYDTVLEAVEDSALRDDEIADFLEEIESRHVLVVFDSCYSGGGARGERSLPSPYRPIPGKVDIFNDLGIKKRVVLAAATEVQQALEDPALGHGVFTHFLLKGLKGEADRNGDHKVTVYELYEYLGEEVPAYVKKHFGEEQTPQLIGEGRRGLLLSYPNLTPVAAVSWEPEKPCVGEEIRFGDRSRDSDGRIVSWSWDFGDGTQGEGRAPSHVYTEPGKYVVTLWVTDDRGAEATATATVTVVANPPPVAAFSWLPSEPWATEEVIFRDESYDPQGEEIISWEWDFGDGTGSNERSPTHQYAYPGTYTVTLRVRDESGIAAEASATIEVKLASYILGVPAEAAPNRYLVFVVPEERELFVPGAEVEVFRRTIGKAGVFEIVVAKGEVVELLGEGMAVVEVIPLVPEPILPGLFVRLRGSGGDHGEG